MPMPWGMRTGGVWILAGWAAAHEASGGQWLRARVGTSSASEPSHPKQAVRAWGSGIMRPAQVQAGGGLRPTEQAGSRGEGGTSTHKGQRRRFSISFPRPPSPQRLC